MHEIIKKKNKQQFLLINHPARVHEHDAKLDNKLTLFVSLTAHFVSPHSIYWLVRE